MCCGKICMMCTCLILVVIAIGMLFGFGVFSKAFHKVHNELHYSYPQSDRDPIGTATGHSFDASRVHLGSKSKEYPFSKKRFVKDKKQPKVMLQRNKRVQTPDPGNT